MMFCCSATVGSWIYITWNNKYRNALTIQSGFQIVLGLLLLILGSSRCWCNQCSHQPFVQEISSSFLQQHTRPLDSPSGSSTIAEAKQQIAEPQAVTHQSFLSPAYSFCKLRIFHIQGGIRLKSILSGQSFEHSKKCTRWWRCIGSIQVAGTG